MKKIAATIAVFSFLLSACGQFSVTGLYPIATVVDGDTVTISIDGSVQRVRIIGINTPETVDPRKPVQCFGPEASKKAKQMLTGKTVRFETDANEGDRDIYGRLLRYIFLPDETEAGTDYGKLMISQGYAREYTFKKPYKLQAEYRLAQQQAKNAKLGLWASCVKNRRPQKKKAAAAF